MGREATNTSRPAKNSGKQSANDIVRSSASRPAAPEHRNSNAPHGTAAPQSFAMIPKMASQESYARLDPVSHAHSAGPITSQHDSGASGETPTGLRPVPDQVLNSQGQPLDANVRSFMEARFGHDFGAVRVHTDVQAANSASRIDARAYTIGDHIGFRQGEYNPSAFEGRRLVAHELAHVVQNHNQDGREQSPSEALSHPGDRSEGEAARAAEHVMSGGPVEIRATPDAVVHRDDGSSTSKRSPVPAKMDPAQASSDFIEGLIEFLKVSADAYRVDLRVKSVALDEGKLALQLARWEQMLSNSEGLADARPDKDDVKKRLRAAYLETIEAAIAFAADRLKQTTHATYQKYRDSIADWALPQAVTARTADELTHALPEHERQQLTVITSGVTFNVDDLFSTKGGTTTIPLPSGVIARFSSETPGALRHGLENVAGTIIPKPLTLNSTMTLTLDLEPYGGQYSAYRFTYVQHTKPARREVLIENLGVIGVEGLSKTQAASVRDRFDAHGFKRGSGWSDAEFSAALAAIAKLPDKMLTPIDGITFARADKDRVDPDTGGNYDPATHTITMFDRVFSATSTRFGKPGELSDDTVRSVTHEIGHAIDLLPIRKRFVDRDTKAAALTAAFAQYESPPGSGNFTFPSTEQAKFNRLKARLDAAERAILTTRSESGEHEHIDRSGALTLAEGGRGAGSSEFQEAALKDGGRRITQYSNKEWVEYYAESFSLYISSPDTLKQLRPNIFKFFITRHPK